MCTKLHTKLHKTTLQCTQPTGLIRHFKTKQNKIKHVNTNTHGKVTKYTIQQIYLYNNDLRF